MFEKRDRITSLVSFVIELETETVTKPDRDELLMVNADIELGKRALHNFPFYDRAFSSKQAPRGSWNRRPFALIRRKKDK